jgi:RsiW-degrading membrane proteinase PrsW (M82 family)
MIAADSGQTDASIERSVRGTDRTGRLLQSGTAQVPNHLSTPTAPLQWCPAQLSFTQARACGIITASSLPAAGFAMTQWYIAQNGTPEGPYSAAQLIERAQLRQLPPSAMFWREGLAAWISLEQAWPDLSGGRLALAAAPPPPPTPKAQAVAAPSAPERGGVMSFADRIADLARVERLEGFSLSELMSATFKKQGAQAIERHFSDGLLETTPKLKDVETGWPKPWMFVRLLLMSVLLFGGTVFLFKSSGNVLLLPSIIMLGSFAAPLATVVFFFELNSPRNVSLYLLIRLAVLGGVVSIGLSLFLFYLTSTLSWVGPPLAGLVEEIGKLVTVFVVCLHLEAKRYPYLLNGMLFGAAVGAGFAAFESMGYALIFFLQADGNFDVMMEIIMTRGVLAPFSHVVWTALAAGALWRVKLDQSLRIDMLWHQRVLRMLLVVMPLHAIWNLGVIPSPYLVKHLVLGLISWIVVFSLLQTGLKQIKAAQMAQAEGTEEISGATMVFKRAGVIGGAK